MVAPPYDIISPTDQKRFYQQDPHNVVRLIAGEVHPSDTPQDNKYTRAAAFFREWLADGILRREASPRLYVYRHQYVDPTSGASRSRLGILGVVELEPFGRGVLPHEQTHARAKADRLSLTRAVIANLSPVFALYEDPESAVRPIIEPAMANPPLMSITGDDGDHHTIWSLEGGQRFAQLAEIFDASTLYIADGHHRYETALNFRNFQRQQHPEAPPDAAFNYVLMMLVDVRDAGLTILPTHRVLHDLVIEELEGLLHRQVVPCAASNQRDSPTNHAVGAAHDLLLVAAEAVSEQQEDLIFSRRSSLGAGRDGGTGLAQIARSVASDAC